MLVQLCGQGGVLGVDAQQELVQFAQEGQQQPRLGVRRGQGVFEEEDVLDACWPTADGRRLTAAGGVSCGGRRTAVGRLPTVPLNRLQPQRKARIRDRVLLGAEDDAHALPGGDDQRQAVEGTGAAVVQRLADGHVAAEVDRQVVAGVAQLLLARVVLAQLGQFAVVAEAGAHQAALRLGGHVGDARQVAPGVGLGAATVVVLAHGAAEVDVVVGFGGRGQQQGGGPVAQELLDSQAVGGQLELVHPLAGVDDAPFGVHGIAVVQPDGVERLFQQEGVEGDLDEVLVAGGLAGLEVPDAQPAAAVADGQHLQQVGPGGADANEGGVEAEAIEEVALVVGRLRQVEEDLGGEARRGGAAQHLGQIGQGQGADGAAAVVVVEAHVEDLVGAVVALELFQSFDFEGVAGAHQQGDAGAAVEAGGLGDVPADAGAAAVALFDAVPAVLPVAAVLEVGGDDGGAEAKLLVHGKAPLL